MSETSDMPSRDELAGEYALGVQTAAEREASEKRLQSDPEFAQDVAAWNERLMPMVDALPAVEPPRVVWMRILAQLGQPVSAPVRTESLWQSASVWRGATAAFATVAAAAVGFIILSPATRSGPVEIAPLPAEANLTSVGMLKAEGDGRVNFVITYDRAAQRLIIAPVAGHSPVNRSYEVWMLPEGAPAVSMGVLDGSNVITLDASQLIQADGEVPALAVSLEPEGGSPTGQRTGPIVAVGALQPL